MYPDKHFRDIKSSSRRRKALEHFTLSAFFLVFLVLLGPFIHEAAHISVLWLVECSYQTEFGFTILNGLFASVKPLCTPEDYLLAVFYSSGYIATLLAGNLLVLASKINDSFISEILAAAGSGSLISILLSAGVEGDIRNLLEVLYLDPGTGIVMMAVLVAAVIVSSLRGIEKLLSA